MYQSCDRDLFDRINITNGFSSFAVTPFSKRAFKQIESDIDPSYKDNQKEEKHIANNSLKTILPLSPSPFDEDPNDTPEEAFRKEVMRIRFRVQKQFLQKINFPTHLHTTQVRLQRLATMDIPEELVRASKIMKVLRKTLEEHKNSDATQFPNETKTLCTDILSKLQSCRKEPEKLPPIDQRKRKRNQN